MNLLVESVHLDGALKKLSTSEEVLNYLNAQDLFSVYFVTPTFGLGKFCRTSKEFGYTYKSILEFDGTEINDVFQKWVAKYLKVRYFFRLDLGPKLGFHYHGFINTNPITMRDHVIPRMMKSFGKLKDSGGVRSPEKTTKYIMGLDSVHLDGSVANSKASLKIYCDKGILTNIYTECFISPKELREVAGTAEPVDHPNQINK